MAKHNYRLPFPAIPEIPEEIINAIDNGNLLLFVGAGVSKLIGYPLWLELGEKLAKKAYVEHLLSLSEKEILLGGGFTPMQIVSILVRRFDDKEPGLGIKRVINELSPSEKINNKKASEIATYLSSYNATIVTTNADESLESADLLSERKVLKNFRNFDYDNFGKNSIIHLHGDVSDPNGMVFTNEQYAEAYNVENKFGQKLNALFKKDWTILFVGYGVSEFELLRYFLNYKNDKVRRMFMLDGYLAKDRIKYDFNLEYYKSLGIYLLPYSREKNDYDQLLHVLKAWDKEVKTRTFAATIVRESNIKDMTSKKPFPESVKSIERLVNGNG